VRNVITLLRMRAVACMIVGVFAAATVPMLSARAQSPSLAITSPAPGVVVEPGQQITVAAQATNGFAPVMVLIVAPSQSAQLSASPFSTSLTIPSNTAGPFTIGAFGRDGTGTILSDQVTIQVSPTATVTGIAVNPLVFNVSGLGGGSQQITVTGTYSDGVSRNVTSSATGTTYQSDTPSVATVDANGLIQAVGMGAANLSVANSGQSVTIPVAVRVQPNVLYSAVLPDSRSVAIGETATAFATIINTGATATSCGLSSFASIPATFVFQTTDPQTNQLTGTGNTPVDIPAGQSQSFVFAFTPTAPFNPVNAALLYQCTNTTPAQIQTGLNTLLLSGSATPVPDVVALGATITNDGIVDIPGATGTGAFAVATVNVGASGTITATTTTRSNLPLSISLCQTVPSTGACMAAPSTSVTTTISADATPTFAIFCTGSDQVPFSPATNRIEVRFSDVNGIVRGATSVAVRTQ
jgi:hypothetical protein